MPIRNIQVTRPVVFVVENLPPLALSLVVAELFFKFGSFVLECLAFLGLWYLTDVGYAKMRQHFGRQ